MCHQVLAKLLKSVDNLTEKMTTLAPTIICLSYRIDSKGLHPIEGKFKMVELPPEPTNFTEL